MADVTITTSGGKAASSQVQPLKIYNMQSYLHDNMHKDVEEFIQSGRLKSGYKNLDAITNLYPGLYVVGAISSLGKTTWVHQMADQMAEAGERVVYFSMEQNVLELASKSLARIQAKKDMSTAMTSLQIRKNDTDSRVTAAQSEYSKYAGNLVTVECSFRATIEDIESMVTNCITKQGIKPIVMVDYLQVIQPPKDFNSTTKDEVDLYLRRLKQLQSDHKLVMILISSLNRQNYLSQIDFESFKESGGIEYTADVVWGLQLQAIHDKIFDEKAKLNEKREIIRAAKKANPRKIELICLKNRFGISGYHCDFKYYPAYDYFEPDMDNLDMDAIEAAAEKDPDGFIDLPEGVEPPDFGAPEEKDSSSKRKSF